jgi:hypothetical protein
VSVDERLKLRISAEEFRALIALRHHVRAFIDLDKEAREKLPLAAALREAERLGADQ